MGPDEALTVARELTSVGLSNLETAVASDVARWTAGIGLCGYTANRLYTMLANYKRLPWARSKGITAQMHFRFNSAIWLFAAVTLTGGALNVIADIKELGCYHLAYKPLHALMAFSCAGLIVFNYGQMIWRGFEQEALGRVWGRIAYAYTLTRSRGVNLFELLLIPLVFFFPWIGAVQALRALVEMT